MELFELRRLGILAESTSGLGHLHPGSYVALPWFKVRYR